MKFLKTALAATAVMSLAATAHAQDTGAYGAVGIDTFEFDAYTLSARLGYNFSEYFGVEGQGGFGIIDDDETFAGAGIDVSIDSSFAGYLTGRIPVSEKFELNGRIGYHTTDLELSSDVGSASDTADGIAVGAGGTYWLNEKNGIRLEYTYLDSDFDGADTVSLSFQRKF